MFELLLFVAGVLGGAVNSLAGGGSFLVFPALLWAGVPPVLANASNTYAALPGYLSGAYGFRKDIARYRERLLPYTIVALIFGYAGAELLLHVSDQQFEQLVPWLIGFAVLLFAFGGRINAALSRSGATSTRLKLVGGALLLVFLALVCLYGGFFNAGLGILLLAFLATAGMSDIHAMNGIKLWISALISVVAVVRFALGGTIDWYHGSIALVGVVIGGYTAARLAHLIAPRVLRSLIIVYGVVLTAYFFWRTYA